MKEHPILFSGEMVRAILDGRKTQTRRVIKPQPFAIQQLQDGRFEVSPDGGFDIGITYVKCPYGVSGDRLWVRETWREVLGSTLPGHELDRYKSRGSYVGAIYKSTPHQDFIRIDAKWKPSIHMPRWASRITLEVVNVLVERLQEISKDDIEKEGFDIENMKPWGPNYAFGQLWNSLNEKCGFGWDANPWVWVIEFRRIES